MIQFYIAEGRIYPIQEINDVVDIFSNKENLIYFNLAKELLEHFGRVKKEEVLEKAINIVKEIGNIGDAELERSVSRQAN